MMRSALTEAILSGIGFGLSIVFLALGYRLWKHWLGPSPDQSGVRFRHILLFSLLAVLGGLTLILFLYSTDFSVGDSGADSNLFIGIIAVVITLFTGVAMNIVFDLRNEVSNRLDKVENELRAEGEKHANAREELKSELHNQVSDRLGKVENEWQEEKKNQVAEREKLDNKVSNRLEEVEKKWQKEVKNQERARENLENKVFDRLDKVKDELWNELSNRLDKVENEWQEEKKNQVAERERLQRDTSRLRQQLDLVAKANEHAAVTWGEDTNPEHHEALMVYRYLILLFTDPRKVSQPSDLSLDMLQDLPEIRDYLTDENWEYIRWLAGSFTSDLPGVQHQIRSLAERLYVSHLQETNAGSP